LDGDISQTVNAVKRNGERMRIFPREFFRKAAPETGATLSPGRLDGAGNLPRSRVATDRKGGHRLDLECNPLYT